jgi:predicted transcriptional regulator
MDDRARRTNLVELAADIVAAWLSRHRVPARELPEALRRVHDVLRELQEAAEAARRPAVPVARSVSDDFIVCLEDGRRLKTLKRHLRAVYGLSPGEYRARWGLPADYPMVAPGYARRRSQLARQHGLGRRRPRKA